MATIIRKIIFTAKAPKPIAAYNQAILADRTLYVSGVLGLDIETMKLVEGGTRAETTQALESLSHILAEAGSSFDKVVKVTILMKNLDDFGTVNEVYSEYFSKDFPARCAYQVAALPMNAMIEIEAIALTGDVRTVCPSVGCGKCGPGGCTCKL